MDAVKELMIKRHDEGKCPKCGTEAVNREAPLEEVELMCSYCRFQAVIDKKGGDE